MIPRLRTVAVMMLAAGLSLGVFATRAIGVLSLNAPASAGRAAPLIEQRVRVYQAHFSLDEVRTDRVRQALVDYDRRVQAKLWELRTQHAAEFDAMAREADERVRQAISEAGR